MVVIFIFLMVTFVLGYSFRVNFSSYMIEYGEKNVYSVF
jgi:hypothetical protein